MNIFLYGVVLQWKLDIRSKSLLVTCYIVPLIFFFLKGGIFTSVMPDMKSTLVQSMIVLSVSMIAQLLFLPSIMLSGIMFPIDLLPKFLTIIGRIFPAFWGYKLMLNNGFQFENLWYLIIVFFTAAIVCSIFLKKQKL